MAEFCTQCATEMGLEESDFKGIPWDDNAPPLKFGEGYSVICEGCGFTLVDEEGNCLGCCWGSYHTRQAHFRVPIERQLASGPNLLD